MEVQGKNRKPEAVEPGQVWSDNDERSIYQEFTILEVADGYALVKRGPVKRRISVERLMSLNGVRGYTYLGRSK